MGVGTLLGPEGACGAGPVGLGLVWCVVSLFVLCWSGRGGRVGVGCVLFENCIVDASIFVLLWPSF